MTKKFALLIVAIMGLAAPASAQSVRVITGGGIEHVYGPGGQLQDDDALRARNERAERDLQAKRLERDTAARQEEAAKALADQAAAAADEQGISTGLLLGGPAPLRYFPRRPRGSSQSTTDRPNASRLR
jgi:hypothetical protein